MLPSLQLCTHKHAHRHTHTHPAAPFHFTPTHPQYLGLAAAACWSEELFIAVFTVDRSLFFHKACICQGCTAVDTVKFLLMPWFPHCYQKWPSEGQKDKQRQKDKWKSTLDFTWILQNISVLAKNEPIYTRHTAQQPQKDKKAKHKWMKFFLFLCFSSSKRDTTLNIMTYLWFYLVHSDMIFLECTANWS